MWIQKQLQLPTKPRGFHLITHEVTQQLPELKKLNMGLAHFFIQHTSASLAINENADPTVRHDMETFFNDVVADDKWYFTHTTEGSDDMPAHLKSVLIGTELTLPISNGRLLLGTWQGLYLCEHRNRGGQRRLIVTLQGE